MQTPPPEAPVSFLEAARRALEGDPIMVREVLGAVGAFSVRLLVAAIILALTLWAAKRLSNFARRALGRLPHRNHPGDTTLSDFLSGLVKWLVIAVGLVAVLQQVGVQTASVLAILGAASLAVGLALQGTLSNVAAGVMILLLRPYRIGDRVEIHGRSGKISDLDLFHTTVVDYDGLTLVYPNGKVFGELIVNVDGSGRRRIDLAFGVDYEDDLDLAPSARMRRRRSARPQGPGALVTGDLPGRQLGQRHTALLDHARRLAERQVRSDQDGEGAVRGRRLELPLPPACHDDARGLLNGRCQGLSRPLPGIQLVAVRGSAWRSRLATPPHYSKQSSRGGLHRFRRLRLAPTLAFDAGAVPHVQIPVARQHLKVGSRQVRPGPASERP